MSQIATVLRLIALWAGFSFALAAQPIQVTSMPTGLKPLGIASMNYATPGLFYYGDYLVVANSGDNSVSVFSYDMFHGLPPSPVTVIQGISDPHAVIHYCGESAIGEVFADSYRFVVTSPSDNSVSVVQVNGSDAATSGRGSLSTTITRVPVGKQPVSAACFLQSSGKSVIAVSNYADRSVTLIDGASFKVTATVPGVPGNADLHGIGGPALGSVAWIVGTDANTLTLLDLNAAKVLSQISVQQPLAIQGTQVDTATGVLSFDPATLKPTPILAVPGVQVFASPGFGPGSSQIPFAISGNGAATSLNLISSGMLYAIPQASNPQDMMVQQTAFCYVTSRICMYSDAQLIVTSRDSNSLIVIPAPAVPRDFAVVNAGNTTTLVAPGSLASIYVPTGVSQAFFADTSPLPASLGGVTLRIGGSLQLTPSQWLYPAVNSVQARLLYVDPNQINFQVPPGLATGSAVPLQLQKPDGTTLLTTLRIGATAPGIFTVLVTGTRRQLY